MSLHSNSLSEYLQNLMNVYHTFSGHFQIELQPENEYMYNQL